MKQKSANEYFATHHKAVPLTYGKLDPFGEDSYQQTGSEDWQQCCANHGKRIGISELSIFKSWRADAKHYARSRTEWAVPVCIIVKITDEISIGTGAVGICEPSTAESITCDYLTNSHI